MDLELILFKACPFAHRVVITLLHTQQEHRYTFINPAQKPDWIQAISPLGQIPLLRVDGTQTLFESSAINDYLNDISGGKLLPADSLQRARCRCWIEYSGVCQRAFGDLITAKDENQFHEAGINFLNLLGKMEEQLGENSRYFMGDPLSLVDIAFAPLFVRMHSLQSVVALPDSEPRPKIEQWQAELLALEVVQQSVNGDFFPIFKNMVRGRGKDGLVDSRLV